MDWIRENWFWIVVGGLFLWLHTKMHGGHGHGGHGGHGGARGHDHGHRQDEPSRPADTTPARPTESGRNSDTRQGGHTHAEH